MARKRPTKSASDTDPDVSKHHFWLVSQLPLILALNRKQSKLNPNMGMSYLFSNEDNGLTKLSELPIRRHPNPLMTSTDQRFAGMRTAIGDAARTVTDKGKGSKDND